MKFKYFHRAIVSLVAIVVVSSVSAQVVDYSGYVSGISSMLKYSNEQKNQYRTDFFLRQRNNFTYYPNNNLTFHLEFQEQYSSIWYKNNENYLRIKADRFYASYMKNHWEINLGRQRINWGRTLVWNPNDIFNTFSFYDIDYPERQGSDALRITYSWGMASSTEIVFKYDNQNSWTSAILSKFNKYNYDFQFLAGIINKPADFYNNYTKNYHDLVLGMGWEGSIGPIAFRGECSYYYNPDYKSSYLSSISFDYSLNSKWNIQTEFLYNDPKYLIPISQFNTLINSAPSSSKSLSFSKYNIYTGASYIISPIFTLNLSSIYYPDKKCYFIMPGAEFSLLQNLNLGVILQHFTLKEKSHRNNFDDLFIRLRYYFK